MPLSAKGCQFDNGRKHFNSFAVDSNQIVQNRTVGKFAFILLVIFVNNILVAQQTDDERIFSSCLRSIG